MLLVSCPLPGGGYATETGFKYFHGIYILSQLTECLHTIKESNFKKVLRCSKKGYQWLPRMQLRNKSHLDISLVSKQLETKVKNALSPGLLSKTWTSYPLLAKYKASNEPTWEEKAQTYKMALVWTSLWLKRAINIIFTSIWKMLRV